MMSSHRAGANAASQLRSRFCIWRRFLRPYAGVVVAACSPRTGGSRKKARGRCRYSDMLSRATPCDTWHGNKDRARISGFAASTARWPPHLFDGTLQGSTTATVFVTQSPCLCCSLVCARCQRVLRTGSAGCLLPAQQTFICPRTPRLSSIAHREGARLWMRLRISSG